MQIDNFGNSSVIVSLADGTTVYYHRKSPVACFIPEKGFFRMWHMHRDAYLVTHKYVKNWRSAECTVISDSEVMENLIKGI